MGKFVLEEIASGSRCEMESRYSLLACTKAEWEKHWKLFFPRKKPLDYDFSKVSIIGVCYGESSKETFVRILHIEPAGNRLEVDVGYCIGSNKLVCQPYHFVKIPKTGQDASFSYRRVARTALGRFPGPFK